LLTRCDTRQIRFILGEHLPRREVAPVSIGYDNGADEKNSAETLGYGTDEASGKITSVRFTCD
jgi:hypothetical protein